MSGHSKWATIKHKKGAQDKARGKLFAKLIRQLEVAAREGGSDLEGNPTLRTMFQKARDASVPMDTIDRAIKRGTGDLEGVRYEPMSFEGYAAACGARWRRQGSPSTRPSRPSCLPRRSPSPTRATPAACCASSTPSKTTTTSRTSTRTSTSPTPCWKR